MTTDLRIIRRLEIENRFGMGRSLLYKEMARGAFPSAIKLTSSTGRSGAAGWIESEVVQYFKDRIAESRPVIADSVSAIPSVDHGVGSSATQHRS